MDIDADTYSEVYNTDAGRMVTNPPYQTPELGDAPDEMQNEADVIYKKLRETTFHKETPGDRASAASVMWSVLKKKWKKDDKGKWVKKEKAEVKNKDLPFVNTDDADGHWVTTDGGGHLFITDSGEAKTSGRLENENRNRRHALNIR